VRLPDQPAASMASYTVHHSARTPDGIMRDPDDVVLIREGFAWGAFAFAPFWLLAKGLWLTAALHLVAIVGISALLDAVAAPGSTSLIVLAAAQLLVGCEANNLRRWKLGRRGRREAGVVVAASLSEAERRFFAVAMAAARESERPQSRSAPAAGHSVLPQPPPAPVGFFPVPGGRA